MPELARGQNESAASEPPSGQHVVLGAEHGFSELWIRWQQGLDQPGPVFFRACRRGGFADVRWQ